MCVTRGWAGRGNAFCRNQPVARKLPENAATPTRRVHLRRTKTVLFPQRNWAQGSILRSGRHISRTKQWRRTIVAVPRCTLVSGPDDPSIGGGRLGAMTPFRKLFLLSDRVCPRQMTITSRRRFRKWARRFFVVNSLSDFSLQLLYASFLERCVRRFLTCLPSWRIG